jgi:hypothetical protein
MPWWEWAFSGIGGAVVVGIGGYIFRRARSRPATQSINAGANSVNVQAGRDVTGVRGANGRSSAD